MLACSMVPSAYVPTLAHREPVMPDSALMAVLETALSKCVEGLVTSTSSTRMHIKLQLMTGAVVTQSRTPTTRSGIKTWVVVVQ